MRLSNLLQSTAGGPVAIVCAHPDDEVIGAGAHLHELRKLVIVHTTDGSPRNLGDARAAGFSTREAYAAGRRREMEAALEIVGLDSTRLRELGFADQETSFHLPELTRRMLTALEECGAAVVLTHPYEGGHPDHDATAFAVHAAVRRMRRPAEVIEFTSYHDSGWGIAAGTFLPNGGSPVTTIPLDREARLRKRRMLECFTSQRETLRPFRCDVERFRSAPDYDFCMPPGPCGLYYERFSWGITGARWRELAASALQELSAEARRGTR